MYGHVKVVGRSQSEVKSGEAIKSASKCTKSKANESIHQKKKDEKLHESKRRDENMVTEPG